MPLVIIELNRGKGTEVHRDIIDAVSVGLEEVLQISRDKHFFRIIELDNNHLRVPEALENELFIITIELFPGRSRELKQKLYHKIAGLLRNISAINVDKLTILLREHPLENWGIRGGNIPEPSST